MSQAPARVVFELKRGEILPFVAGSLVFTLLGLWMVSHSPEEIRSWGGRYGNPWTTYLFGYAAILFFGAIFVSASLKLLGKKEGVVIDSEGITDNSSGVAAGFIPWRDIKRMRIHKGWLLVELTEPDRYVNRGWPLKRLFNHLNRRFYGSPVVLSNKVLDCGLEDILSAADEIRKSSAND